MSEENMTPDAPDTAQGHPPADAEPAGGASELAAGETVPGDGPTISEASDRVGFAATVLGDTLPSAVRDALSAHAAAGHAHAAAGHEHGTAHGDEHFAHTLPMKMLLGVLGALVILTILTVAVTSIDLGSQGNFIIAMIIATIKAALVMGYFMHLVWDSKFNVFAFLSSFLFVLLFLSMTLLDRGEYQSGIDHFEADQKTQKK